MQSVHLLITSDHQQLEQSVTQIYVGLLYTVTRYNANNYLFALHHIKNFTAKGQNTCNTNTLNIIPAIVVPVL